MKQSRLVIADDHPVVRDGLLGMLESQTDFEAVGEAADGEVALQSVLMDLRMPGMGGIEAIRLIRADQYPI